MLNSICKFARTLSRSQLMERAEVRCRTEDQVLIVGDGRAEGGGGRVNEVAGKEGDPRTRMSFLVGLDRFLKCAWRIMIGSQRTTVNTVTTEITINQTQQREKGREREVKQKLYKKNKKKQKRIAIHINKQTNPPLPSHPSQDEQHYIKSPHLVPPGLRFPKISTTTLPFLVVPPLLLV